MQSQSRFILVGIVVAAAALILYAKQSQPQPQQPPQEIVSPSAQALPRLVCLGAGKCIPCKAMKPIREELKKELAGQLLVVFHDVWKDQNIGNQYGVRVIPTTIFYGPDGKELTRTEGFIAKQDILARFGQYGITFPDTP